MIKTYYILYGVDDLDHDYETFVVSEELSYALKTLNYIKEAYDNKDLLNEVTAFDWYGIERIVEDLDTDNIRLVSRKTRNLIYMIPDKGKFIVRFFGNNQESCIFDKGEKIDYEEEW